MKSFLPIVFITWILLSYSTQNKTHSIVNLVNWSFFIVFFYIFFSLSPLNSTIYSGFVFFFSWFWAKYENKIDGNESSLEYSYIESYNFNCWSFHHYSFNWPFITLSDGKKIIQLLHFHLFEINLKKNVINMIE